MGWYSIHYRKLFFIPVILLILSVGVIAWTVSSQGTFVYKGVSLSGGVSATVSLPDSVSADDIFLAITTAFPQADINVRELTSANGLITYVIEAAHIDPDERVSAEKLQSFLSSEFGVDDASLEATGPALGSAFFLQTIMGVLLAFLWMGWVVYLYFGSNKWIKILMFVVALIASQMVKQGTFAGSSGALFLSFIVVFCMMVYFYSSIPAGAVILAAASTIIFTTAVIDLLRLRLSTAGVAAFLMLIGYSVDTDILLSTRVLKQSNLSIDERFLSAFKTGITMQITTFVAVLSAFLLTNSEVIKQIMLILLIGMLGDVIFTWIQNAGILYWHDERNEPAVKKNIPSTSKANKPKSKKSKKRGAKR